MRMQEVHKDIIAIKLQNTTQPPLIAIDAYNKSPDLVMTDVTMVCHDVSSEEYEEVQASLSMI